MKLPQRFMNKLVQQRLNDRRRHIFVHAKDYYEDAKEVIPFASSEGLSTLKRCLIDYAVRYAKCRVDAERHMRALSQAFFLVYILVTWAPFLAINSYSSTSSTLLPGFLILCLASLVALAAATGIVRIFPYRSPWYVLFAFIPLMIVGIAGTELVQRRSRNDLSSLFASENAFQFGLASLAVCSAGLAITLVPSFLVSLQMVEKFRLYRAARYAVLHELILALVSLSGGSTESSRPDSKRHIITHLERAAIYLQIGIPKSTMLQSPTGRAILQQRCDEAANAIRSLQTDIAFPGSKTHENAKFAVAHAVVSVAQDNLEAMPKKNVCTKRGGRLIRIVLAIRTIAISGIPLGVLIIVRYADLNLSSEFENWAIVIAILWAIITVLSLLDPLYATRIKTMSDLISAIRGKDVGS